MIRKNTTVLTYNVEAMERHIKPENLCILSAKGRRMGIESSLRRI